MANKLDFINKINKLTPVKDNIVVNDMKFDLRVTSGGIFLPGDDGKTSGIRPRWAQVYAIGSKQKDVTVGQWVMVEHGRWTHGFKVEIDGKTLTLRKIDPAAILFVSDEPPSGDDVISSAVQVTQKSLY